MGAWGSGPFDNDDAADWVYKVETVSDLSAVRQVLTAVAGTDEYVEAPQGSLGMAAATLLAGCADGGTDGLPATLVDWVHRVAEHPTSADLLTAVAAIDRILGADSELRDLWGEQAGGTWLHSTEDLRARLGSQVMLE